MGDLRHWIAAASVVLGAGCSAPTQISLTITTDVPCSDDQGTTVTVGAPGAVQTKAPAASTNACTDAGMVGTLVVVPSGADDATVAVLVVLGSGKLPAACVAPTYGPGCVVAQRIVQYVPHQNVLLPIFLSKSCDGIACGSGETCVEGGCVSATIPDPGSCTAGGGCGEGVLTGAGDGGFADGPAMDASVSDGPVSDTMALDSTLVVDAGGCSADGGCYAVPAGWTLAGFDSTSTTTPCPAGYQSATVVADPVPSAGQCSYQPCAVAAPPVCSVTAKAGPGCSIDFGAIGDGCQDLAPASVSAPIEFTASASGGTCNAVVSANPILPNALVCTNPSLCDGGICSETYPVGFQTCLLADGSQTCPAGLFAEAHMIAATAAADCAAAPCTVTATCAGTVSLFSGNACGGTAGQRIAANGTCTAFSGSYGALQYAPQLGSVTCAATTPSPNPPTLTGSQTLCCRP